jgi:enoyl-CoA hydratase/carnithine racemase
MSSEVQTTIEHGIMTVTINSPEAKNAINRAVSEAIAQAMDELDSNPALRLAILTGSNNTFCSGMDLKAFARGEVPVIEGRGFAGLCEAPRRRWRDLEGQVLGHPGLVMDRIAAPAPTPLTNGPLMAVDAATRHSIVPRGRARVGQTSSA